MIKKGIILFCCILWCATAGAQVQDTARFLGNVLPNLNYHHGQLPPVLGIHNI